jgi:hypothetical protein
MVALLQLPYSCPNRQVSIDAQLLNAACWNAIRRCLSALECLSTRTHAWLHRITDRKTAADDSSPCIACSDSFLLSDPGHMATASCSVLFCCIPSDARQLVDHLPDPDPDPESNTD